MLKKNFGAGRRKCNSMPMTDNTQRTLKTVSDRHVDLFKTMKLSDCSFVVGPEDNTKIFKAHKLVLSIASPVFETMFFGGLAEIEYPVKIPDIDPETFQTLLEYIYTDRIKIGTTFENATTLCYAAQKYMLSHVFEYCINHLTSNLNPINACRVYEFAKFFDKPELLEASMQMITKNTTKVLADPGFVDIKMSTLTEIIERDDLSILSEVKLFDALDRYAKSKGLLTAECEGEDTGGDASLLRQAVKGIRFLVMTPKEFAEGPASSNLLHNDEKYAILMNISSEKVKDCPMPKGFSTLKSSRRCLRRGYYDDYNSDYGY